MNIIIALLLFSFIVIFHELGHFSLAKANGIEVTEFSLGMGPRIITFVKGEKGFRIFILKSTEQLEAIEEIQKHTWYSWKILPFGGSCMMLGEEETVDSDRSFSSKSVYARMSVIFAGPFFNFILAFLLAIIIIATIGYDKPCILEIDENSPMQEAGFEVGDEITDINGEKILITKDISSHFQFEPLTEEPISITILRDGDKITKSVTPKLEKNKKGEDVYRVGIRYSSSYRQKTDVVGVLKYSAYEVKYWIVTTIKSLGMIGKGKVSKDDISGPVGIVSLVGDTVEESKKDGIKYVWINLINFAILLTANLGVMNLLPIPALDGGRLLFLFVEWITRKPLNEKFQAVVNLIGFALLMLLMIFVMFNDVSKFFR